MLRLLLAIVLLPLAGCSILPEIAHQPTLHNPFPQLSKVAIAPFVNHSAEPTLNGSEVAAAYGDELQTVRGFEVVPVTTVEAEMRARQIWPDTPENARLLAQALGVDVLVVGVVTAYDPYKPRMTMKVEWYAANPYFQKIPPGYGLPWGTPEEEHIPAPLVLEAEMAYARAQMETQTPPYEKSPALEDPAPQELDEPAVPDRSILELRRPTEWGEGVQPQSYEQPVVGEDGQDVEEVPEIGLPEDWPDPRGFIPPPPMVRPVTSAPNVTDPVLEHVHIYNGDDSEFTEALASYCYFRDDARFGGWQFRLQNMPDFIRFCCYMHISGMLSARGGAGETRVVWRWPTIR